MSMASLSTPPAKRESAFLLPSSRPGHAREKELLSALPVRAAWYFGPVIGLIDFTPRKSCSLPGAWQFGAHYISTNECVVVGSHENETHRGRCHSGHGDVLPGFCR